ncbi:hypothetical protein [Polyangium fumosum]|uniref:Uncharacterized protein n=1 Tax=Polyangium fumosum TaxID=889272 RepID=A0A4V5PN79_9BACT|nr:hypothetical protein [Polyangium fumosum]TKD09993.1 hypothetical protein E8A74_10325 [Polyangium fumosum]
MMSPDPRTTTTTTSTTTTTTTTTSTTSTAATSMINAASVALPSTPPSASVACAAGKVAEPSSSAPAKKERTPEEIREFAGKVEDLVEEAVSLQQQIVAPETIGELYQDLYRVKRAGDTNVLSKWTAFHKFWGTTLVPLKKFVDQEKKRRDEEKKQKELIQRNEQRRTQGNEDKQTLIAAEQVQKKLREKQHQQEVAALARAHKEHFNDPKALTAIVSDNPTLCTAVVEEGTQTTMAFGISSVGNHRPFQAFYRDQDGMIRCTKAAEVYAKVLEPLRAELNKIQCVEAWEVYVCAEVDAAVQLLLRGVRLEQIKTYATDFDFKYKARCAHCTQWVTEF